MPYIGWLGVLIILIVMVLWILGLVDLLKRKVPRKDFYLWLGIIIVLPVIGFILYHMLAVPNIRIRH